MAPPHWAEWSVLASLPAALSIWAASQALRRLSGYELTFLPADFSIMTPASALGTCNKAAAARLDSTIFMESSRLSGSSAPPDHYSVKQLISPLQVWTLIIRGQSALPARCSRISKASCRTQYLLISVQHSVQAAEPAPSA